MSLIKMESLFPEDYKRSQGTKAEGATDPQDSSFLPPNLPLNFELIDLTLIKKTNISVNSLYNLLLEKNMITTQEYHDMKNHVHRLLYPEDFT